MIYPTLEELSKEGKYNRYTVAVAAAKGARLVTDEYVSEREHAEQMVARKETDKSINALISPDLRDDKAVRTAVHRLRTGEYEIDDDTVPGADGKVHPAEKKEED